jgi:YjbE family integral membrane protein
MLLPLLSAAAATTASPVALWHRILADFAHLTEPAALAAFASVLVIDLVLAGDNAIVVGALAAGLPAAERRRVILLGISAALVLRILFALVATWLMGITGLIFIGGLLLLWVSWRFWREIRSGDDNPQNSAGAPRRSFLGAAWAVAMADVSMSLDNVLAVAGAARAHPGVLVIGLLLSVALMGLAANLIAQVIDRFRWIAYVGLSVIVFVALRMVYEGWVGTDETRGLSSLLA